MVSSKFLGVALATFVAFIAFTFTACSIYIPSVVEVAYTPEESAKLGFNFDEGSD